MLSWDKSADRSVIVQMNAGLRDAQLELLSACCATDRIRLSFSIEDVAQHGQRDILRKALEATTVLHRYYTAVEEQISAPEGKARREETRIDEGQILTAIAGVVAYVREQRERYLSAAKPLSARHHKLMEPFFPPLLLRDVRIVERTGRQLPKPSFYDDAQALGIFNLPDITHMTSLTFEDVLVFNDRIEERSLFHALIQAVQIQILGLERYVELFVRAFLKTHSLFNVPLEAHTFTLECKFAGAPSRPFLVEEQVLLWVKQGRY
jgi:hypothetical protein